MPEAETDDARHHEWSNQSVNWVEDFLADDLNKWKPEIRKSVRAYWYGYMSEWKFDAPVVTPHSLAQGLLDAIASTCTSECSKDRRIIFVAHSYGGLVVKKALSIDFAKSVSGVVSRTDGVLFFGTPHRGSELASHGRVFAMFLSPWGSDGDIVDFLKRGSNANWELHNSFTNVLDHSSDGDRGSLRVWNFFEEKKTSFGYGLAPRLVRNQPILNSCLH